MSYPRKRVSSKLLNSISTKSHWIPASAGMTYMWDSSGYDYAFRSIEQTDSLTDFIKYAPLSAFSRNIRARMLTHDTNE